jgi:hypothetical protein
LDLDMLEGLIKATYTRDRLAVLSQVNPQLEKLRFPGLSRLINGSSAIP